MNNGSAQVRRMPVVVEDLMQQIARADPPCRGDDRFTSTHPYDHLAAAQLCAGCPAREACLALGHAEDWADGTYGGVRFVKGRVSGGRRREA